MCNDSEGRVVFVKSSESGCEPASSYIEKTIGKNIACKLFPLKKRAVLPNREVLEITKLRGNFHKILISLGRFSCSGKFIPGGIWQPILGGNIKAQISQRVVDHVYFL